MKLESDVQFSFMINLPAKRIISLMVTLDVFVNVSRRLFRSVCDLRASRDLEGVMLFLKRKKTP